MYRTATQLFKPAVAVLGAISLTLTGSLMAGPPGGISAPGKPGQNDILPNGNIVEVAIEANNALGVFDTVLTAAQCPYFDGAVLAILTGEDMVTLFAPVDSGFAELGLDDTNICEAFDGSDDAVGAPEDLLGILAYHVTEGRRFSNSLFNPVGRPKDVEMLSGRSITTAEGKIYDNNMREVNVVTPFVNINASNGAIHVIDRVLLP